MLILYFIETILSKNVKVRGSEKLKTGGQGEKFKKGGRKFVIEMGFSKEWWIKRACDALTRKL